MVDAADRSPGADSAARRRPARGANARRPRRRGARRPRRAARVDPRRRRHATEQRSTAISLAVSGGWNPSLAPHLASRRHGRSGAKRSAALRAGRAAAGHDRRRRRGRAPSPSPRASRTAPRRAPTAAATAASAAAVSALAQSRRREHCGVGARSGTCRTSAARPSSISRTTSPTTDVELAAREGFRVAEHLKRYTTLGMATDQGKTSQRQRPRRPGRARPAARSPSVGTDDVPPALHAGRDRRASPATTAAGISGRRG